MWQFLSARRIGDFAIACGRALISANRESGQSSEAFAFQEGVWHQLSPRTTAFNLWSRDLAEAYTRDGQDAIHFQERVWRRVSASTIDTEALDWARVVVQSHKKQGRRVEALSFQESVWNNMDRAAAQIQYDTWGRNLSMAYLKTGDFCNALRVQEQMWRQMTSEALTYYVWGMELARMYCKAGRSKDAIELGEKMWEASMKKETDFFRSSCLAYSLKRAHRLESDEAKVLHFEAHCMSIIPR